jgi:DNA helicase II / ATP-dependent DNA helicase PcrA
MVGAVSQIPLLEGLDPDQRAAVTVDAAPLRILAGPGSGKTRVLTRRIAWRALQGDVDPRRVLALTFTRKAARELRDRVSRLGVRDVGAVGTFHGVAYAQLRRRALDRGRPAPVVADATRLLGQAAGEVQVAVLRGELQWMRRRGAHPAHYRAEAEASGRSPAGGRDAVGAALGRFALLKQRAGMLDLDDLLAECTRLLEEDATFAEVQHWLFRHVFVDEFQDLNAAQFRLLEAWLGGRDDLCVVGDSDQAVYGWNGADASYLTGFLTRWPTATTLHLGHNHRNPPVLAAAAAAALGRVVADAGALDGQRPTLTEFSGPAAEAEGAARWAEQARAPGEPWRHLAVLARTNDQLSVVAAAMAHHDLPHRIRSSSGALASPAARVVLDRLHTRSDLAEAVEEIEAEPGGPATGAEQRARAAVLAAARELLAEDGTASGRDLSSWLRTVRPGDLGPYEDAVELCTFHGAKGLEWPHVAVIGLEDGLVPISGDDAEERRLLYVAMTRALRTLDLSWCRRREVGGRLTIRRPSPYLGDVAAAATADTVAADPRLARSALARTRAELGSGSAAGLGASSATTLERLLDWRRRTARAAKVSDEAVLAMADLQRLAAHAPADMEALAQLTGWGAVRCQRLGPGLLEALAWH